MKKRYSGLDAMKISFDESLNIITGQSRCWVQVTNEMHNSVCTTQEPGHTNTWRDYNDPNFPITDPEEC